MWEGRTKPTLVNLFPLTLCGQDLEICIFYLPILLLTSQWTPHPRCQTRDWIDVEENQNVTSQEASFHCWSSKAVASGYLTPCLPLLNPVLQSNRFRRCSLGGDWAMKAKTLDMGMCPHHRGFHFPLAMWRLPVNTTSTPKPLLDTESISTSALDFPASVAVRNLFLLL